MYRSMARATVERLEQERVICGKMMNACEQISQKERNVTILDGKPPVDFDLGCSITALEQ